MDFQFYYLRLYLISIYINALDINVTGLVVVLQFLELIKICACPIRTFDFLEAILNCRKLLNWL